MSGTRKVYETVVYDPSRGTGAAGDCTHVIRSTSRAVVERAAKGMTYYGAPATVRCEDGLRFVALTRARQELRLIKEI